MKCATVALLVFSWRLPGAVGASNPSVVLDEAQHSTIPIKSDEINNKEEIAENDDEDRRNLQTTWRYETPPWWDYVAGDFSGINLKRCFKRQFPPEEGAGCARSAKTCYFGTQQCPAGVGPFPLHKCFCNGTGASEGTWSCEFPLECPSNECTGDRCNSVEIELTDKGAVELLKLAQPVSEGVTGTVFEDDGTKVSTVITQVLLVGSDLPLLIGYACFSRCSGFLCKSSGCFPAGFLSCSPCSCVIGFENPGTCSECGCLSSEFVNFDSVLFNELVPNDQIALNDIITGSVNGTVLADEVASSNKCTGDGCLPVEIVLTDEGVVELLKLAQPISEGVTSNAFEDDGSKVSTFNTQVLVLETLLPRSVATICRSSCEGNDCATIGCDASYLSCSTCSCSGGGFASCSACICTRSLSFFIGIDFAGTVNGTVLVDEVAPNEDNITGSGANL